VGLSVVVTILGVVVGLQGVWALARGIRHLYHRRTSTRPDQETASGNVDTSTPQDPHASVNLGVSDRAIASKLLPLLRRDADFPLVTCSGFV
jgi:hypothetical protein